MVDCHGLIDNGEISVTSDKVANEEANYSVVQCCLLCHWLLQCDSFGADMIVNKFLVN